MTATDKYGLELSTTSAAAADAYVEGLDLCEVLFLEVAGFLMMNVAYKPFDNKLVRQAVNYSVDAPAIVKNIFDGLGYPTPGPVGAQVVGADPRLKRYLYDPKKAKELLARAGFANGCDVQLYYSAGRYPKDKEVCQVVAAQMVKLLAYGGDPNRRARVVDALGRLAPHFGSDPWFLGKYSQALCERGELTRAERLAESGLAAHPDHGSLAHSRAHVFYQAGDDRGGRDFLAEWIEDHGRYLVTAGHLSWHLAVTEIAMSDPARAFDLYRRLPKDDRRLRLDDAASLLWRKARAS